MSGLDTLDRGRPAVLGHRGASAHAAENTAAAFRLAREQGADGVELDVRRTGDDELVIHHDAAIAGHAPLVEMSYADATRAHPGLLTFEEAMAECAGLLVNIEVKNAPRDPDYDPADRVAARVAEWVGTSGAYEHALVSSFNPATVSAVRAADDAIATGLLVAPPTDVAAAIPAAAAAGHRAVHPYVDQVEPGLVHAARDTALWTVVWTVDDGVRIRELAALGVNGIIADDPAAAIAALGG